MARRLRLESEAGVYHVLNRGNYRSDIFRSDETKAAFLKCLGEACARTGWRIYAWCIMSNHYHLALATPRANLVEGMQWMQGTFALRFNRFRQERGHLFQGRYKSLIVDPAGGLGPLCHYIHLNPVRARICGVAELRRYGWTSLHWLCRPGKTEAWYDPQPALTHAGNLQMTSAGVSRYLEYLGWLAEDEPARKRLQFESMSGSWVIGTAEFTKEMLREHQELAGCGRQQATELTLGREALWAAELEQELRRMHRTPDELLATSKSAEWKLALAAALKARTTVTNRWLGTNLRLGARDEVCRKLSARRQAITAGKDHSTHHRA